MTNITEQSQRRAALIREIEKAGWEIGFFYSRDRMYTITIRRGPQRIRHQSAERYDLEGAYARWKEEVHP